MKKEQKKELKHLIFKAKAQMLKSRYVTGGTMRPLLRLLDEMVGNEPDPEYVPNNDHIFPEGKKRRKEYNSAKYTEDKIKVVKTLLDMGETHRYISEVTDIPTGTIAQISAGTTWRHVKCT